MHYDLAMAMVEHVMEQRKSSSVEVQAFFFCPFGFGSWLLSGGHGLSTCSF